MSQLDELKKLHEINKEGCVAYAYDTNGNKFFSTNDSFSGFHDQNAVKKIIGFDYCYCGRAYSFTVLKENLPDSVLSVGNKFCRGLKNGDGCICFPIVGRKFFKKDLLNNGYHERYFSCAEKKIIGYFLKKKLVLADLLITRLPCYHCLPVIDSITCLEKNKIRRIMKYPYYTVFFELYYCYRYHMY